MGGKSSSSKPKPTGQERALAEEGARKFNTFARDFLPLKEDFLRGVRTSGTERDALGGDIAAGVAERVSSASGDRDLAARSIQSGRRGGLDFVDAATAQASGVGSGRANLESEIEEREIRGLLRATSLGRGLDDQAQVGTADIGRRATEEGIDRAQNRFDTRRSLVSSAATGLGAAASATNLFDRFNRSGGTGG